MKKVELKKGYVLYGYDIYKPDDIIVFLSYSPEPIEKGATFGFMWHAEVDGVWHEGLQTALSDNPFVTEKEKEETFEIVVNQASRALDELLKDRHAKAGIPI